MRFVLIVEEIEISYTISGLLKRDRKFPNNSKIVSLLVRRDIDHAMCDVFVFAFVSRILLVLRIIERFFVFVLSLSDSLLYVHLN